MIKYNNSQISSGMKIEREHGDTIKYIKSFYRKHKSFPPNSKIYKRIALNHLSEDPKYYTKLKKCKL